MQEEVKKIKISLGRWQTGQRPKTYSRTINGRTVTWTFDRNRPSQRYMADHFNNRLLYEADTVYKLADTLKPCDVFFDVGAHCGYYTTLGIAMGARVLAFEPHPQNAAWILKHNHRAELVEAIVTDGERQPFWENADNDGGHAIWNPGEHGWNEKSREQSTPMTVDHVCLNRFAERRPKVIKIDTEGAEVLILRGARDVLQQFQLKLVIAECNDFGLGQLGCDREEMYDIMRRYGFTLTNEEPDDVNMHNLFFER